MTTSAPSAVILDGLTKRYGDRVAVERLTLEVPSGVVAGLVGPNGAGKTTVMSMLMGLIRPTEGTGAVLGQPLSDPAAYVRRVGALIESPAFYPALTGTENLRVLAAMGDHDRHRVPLVLELVGLGSRGSDRFREYSFGMKQRLGIAGALLGDPDLLILDEPTNGLDPVGSHEMRRLLTGMAREGRTVLVSSHILGELEQVCDWLVVLDRGALVYQGPTSGLLEHAETVVVVTPEHDDDLERLGVLLAAHGLDPGGADGELTVDVNGRDPRVLSASLNRLAHSEGVVLAEVHHRRENLQARYLTLVSGGTR